MQKPISTKTHGMMDYLTAGTLLMLPRVLGFSRPLSWAVGSLAATKLLCSLCTDNELGLWRKLPMKAHLAMDAASGAGLCALPFIMGDEDDDAAKYVLIGAGLNEIMVATMTRTQPTWQSLPRQAARAASRQIERARESVGV